MGGAEIRVSEPVVAFRETVQATSDHVVMSKSPNKHNRLYLQVGGRPPRTPSTLPALPCAWLAASVCLPAYAALAA